MSKYANFKIAIDGESVNMYIETGGEPVHVVYWHLDEWIEDAESSVPASINAVHLYHTNPDELIERISGFGMPDYKSLLLTSEEVEDFILRWGQSHKSICDHLDYEYDGSDDLLMDDYFWLETQEVWCNKSASLFEGKDQLIADYLMDL
jgi:hypothetical protein